MLLNRGMTSDKPTKRSPVRCLEAVFSVSIEAGMIGLAVCNMLLWTLGSRLYRFVAMQIPIDV